MVDLGADRDTGVHVNYDVRENSGKVSNFIICHSNLPVE